MTLGERIKEKRKKLNLNQKELGAKIGLNQKQISNYESNASYPPGDKIETLCKILEITPNYLFGIKDTPPLTEDEKRLLELFNSINENDQKELLGAIKMFIRENFNTQEEENINQIS